MPLIDLPQHVIDKARSTSLFDVDNATALSVYAAVHDAALADEGRAGIEVLRSAHERVIAAIDDAISAAAPFIDEHGPVNGANDPDDDCAGCASGAILSGKHTCRIGRAR